MFSASVFFAVPVTSVCGYIHLLICKAHRKRRATQYCAWLNTYTIRLIKSTSLSFVEPAMHGSSRTTIETCLTRSLCFHDLLFLTKPSTLLRLAHYGLLISLDVLNDVTKRQIWSVVLTVFCGRFADQEMSLAANFGGKTLFKENI